LLKEVLHLEECLKIATQFNKEKGGELAPKFQPQAPIQYSTPEKTVTVATSSTSTTTESYNSPTTTSTVTPNESVTSEPSYGSLKRKKIAEELESRKKPKIERMKLLEDPELLTKPAYTFQPEIEIDDNDYPDYNSDDVLSSISGLFYDHPVQLTVQSTVKSPSKYNEPIIIFSDEEESHNYKIILL